MRHLLWWLLIGFWSVNVQADGRPVREELPELPGAMFIGQPGMKYQSWMRPLNKVQWVESDAAPFMREDDPVLGFSFENEAWAVPWWVLKNFHVANLNLGGQRLLITFCELCSSGSVFIRDMQAHSLTFELIGAYQGSILIRDRETGTLWAPFIGEGLAGKLKGQKLHRLPLYQSLWSQWKDEFPHTRVSYADEKLRLGHNAKSHPGDDHLLGDNMSSTIVTPPDNRLVANRLVLGVESGSVSMAFPLDKLSEVGVAQYFLEQRQIVVFSIPGTLMASAFLPVVNGVNHQFYYSANGEIADRETGSFWNITGEAYQGALKGKRLEYVPSGIEEWYIWSNYHPGTRIWSGPAADSQ